MNKAAWFFNVWRATVKMLPMLLASPFIEAGEANPVPVDKTVVDSTYERRHVPLRPEDRLGDLLNHSAFRGFSHHILPWDGLTYNLEIPLNDIGQLLPYHNHVEPAVVVASLNRMVDDANSGHAVFYDFHTDAQRQKQPTLKNTGLFFFRGKPGAPFAVIAPGGGFSYVGSVHEGFPYADEINKRGFNAFVLKYRVGRGGRAATEDMAAAIAYILRNAHSLQVDTQSYSLWGSSAGARMAAAIGSHGTAQFGAPHHPKPSVVVMAYTGHTEVTTSEPSTFVVVGEDDRIAPPALMETRIEALRRIGTRVEYRRYPNVAHGFGTGQGTSAQGWIDHAIRFWEKEIGELRR